MDNVDSLITPMALTGDIMNTQFYDKVDGYKTLGYKNKEMHIRNTRRKSQGPL